jgi:hypothetical protein
MLQEVNINLKNNLLAFGLTLTSVVANCMFTKQSMLISNSQMSISLISVEISTGLTPINVP